MVEDTADWREEKTTFDAAYNNERMAEYLFLPKKVSPVFSNCGFLSHALVFSTWRTVRHWETQSFSTISSRAAAPCCTRSTRVLTNGA